MPRAHPMAHLEVERTHRQGRDEARSAVEAVAARLQSELGGHYEWAGDVLHFERKGASGQIAVEDGRVHVALTLGRMLRPFRRRIEAEVERLLDRHLAG